MAKLNSDVGILFGYVGRGIVYEEKDRLLLHGQYLIPFVQLMFKDNCSHPAIAVVVVVDFKLAQANSFPLQGMGSCSLANQWGGSLSVPVIFMYNRRLNLYLELRCFEPHSFISKGISYVGQHLVEKAGFISIVNVIGLVFL